MTIQWSYSWLTGVVQLKIDGFFSEIFLSIMGHVRCHILSQPISNQCTKSLCIKTNNTLSHWEGLSCLLIDLIVVYDWKVKDGLPDMTLHRMLLDVGVSPWLPDMTSHRMLLDVGVSQKK